MTEAVTAVQDWVFTERSLPEMIVLNAVGNEPSRRVKEKTGAVFIEDRLLEPTLQCLREAHDFQVGYLEEDPLVMYLMISMLFQLGIEPIAELRGVEPERNQLDLDAYEDAYRRGAAMNQSLLNWDPWPYMDWPLEKLRAELGVPPLDGGVEASPES